MMTAEENDLLCRVEGDAPMGRLMRRYWLPACLSEEVEEPDGTPLRVRVLGQDLVVFRDTAGRLGALDLHCPHRRASLSYGRNEENGLRCLYHGWKLDVEGNVVEMPSEPVESGFCAKVKHRAYPCQEAGGFVWIWMGERDKVAQFERPALAPTDDTHTMFHFIAWNESGEGHDTETWRKFCGAQPAIDLDANWAPRRTLANHHLQDRQAMKLGDFTGIRGIPMQDMAMWASMGPITDRTRDRLGASDLAIVEFRRIMVDAARRFVADGTALGAEAHKADAALCAFEGVIPKSDDWRTLGR